MRAARARWAVALRIARRSAVQSWGRSLLIVLLVAAPIMGLTAAAVLIPSTQSTQAERIANTLGHAEAKLTVVGGPGDHLQQGIEGGWDYVTTGSQSDSHRVDPRTALPASTRVLAIGSGAAVFRTPHGSTSLPVVTGPSWDPVLDGGPYVLLSGRRPVAADEVLLSPAALARLGAHVGGTIRMVEPHGRALTVVGTSRNRSAPSSAQSVFAAASVLPDAPRSPDAFDYYVTSTPVGWTTVERLNALGATVFSRAVLVHPPVLPADRRFGSGSGSDFARILVVAIAVAFAVLEVALLAGAAFLVGARLQQRTLATIASIGAEPRLLRRIVTASGVVLGAIGGVAGVALGIAGALVVMRLTDDGTWARYPGVHLLWPILAGIAVFGVLVGWIAALVPAHAASRFDVVAALRGARTPQKVGKRPVLGVVLLAAGIGATLLGGLVLVTALQASGGGGTLAQFGSIALLGGGPVLAQLGVVLCAGLLLRGLARLLDRAPLATRLAARDTSRNLGRAVPAVASVMTTVFLASFVMCIANTSAQQAAIGYNWQAATPGTGTALIASTDQHAPTVASAAMWEATLTRSLPVAHAGLLSSTPEGSSDTTLSNRPEDAMAVVMLPQPGACSMSALRDPGNRQCGPFSSRGGTASSADYAVTVGSEAALGLLLGHAPSAAALSSLRGGGAVALRTDLAPNGRAALGWYTPKQLADGPEAHHPVRVTHLPATVDLPEHPLRFSLFVTPTTAATLGLHPTPIQVLLSFTRPPTSAELDATNTALGAIANQPASTFVQVETGPTDFGSLIAWYVLLACLLIAIAAGATAIGLARVDGRPDDVTLASLGAAPRIRRSVALVQGLIVCGLGAVIGAALGLLPAVALGGATDSFPFAPPALQLALMVAGIPILLAGGSWLLVGTRGADLTRRTAIA